MAGRARDPGFFVGYLNNVPHPLAIFLVVGAAVLVGGMAGLAFALGTNVNDPGDGTFARKLGKQEMTGVLLEKPYPILRVRPTQKIPRRARSCSPCPASAASSAADASSSTSSST